MTSEPTQLSFASRLRLRWQLLLRAILHWWVKAKIQPKPVDELGIDPSKPVCYVLDSYALSSALILDKACEKVGLPRALMPIKELEEQEHRAYAALKRSKGLLIRRPTARRSSEVIKRLVQYVHDQPDLDIQLVPATVFVGRAPDKETGITKILFSENWEVAGRIRRFLGTLINGRVTMVQYSPPISLRELSEEGLGSARSLRKVSRILRTHFRRLRSAALGPDLSHRRTMVDRIIKSPAVRQSISDKARKDKISEDKARKHALSYIREIAADYSYSFVRIASFALSWFWTKIYDGVQLNHFKAFQKLAPEYEVIYVPCHRSHMDYLLVSYLLYNNGLVPPHVAAGVNLNLPVVGHFLRKGGAFFLRRSFRSQKLYAAVFNEYVSAILAKGVSIEYFIEGTRSRTGRLLPPKAGMLAMTVRGFLRTRARPVMFQPIYVGYEQLTEGNSYTKELSGKSKKSESLKDLFKVFRVLKHKYGEVHVSFAAPIFLNDLLDKHHPEWREEDKENDERQAWLNSVIDDLGEQIMVGINTASDVNPVNLLTMSLMATPKHSLGEAELLDQINLYKTLLEKAPYNSHITITSKSAEEILEYGMELKILQQRSHPLGNIINLNPEQAVALTYFRNNISHLLAAPSLIASTFLNNRTIATEHLHRIATAIYPFLKAELFLPWEEDEFASVLEKNIDVLIEQNLLERSKDGKTLQRPEGGSDESIQLRLLGQTLLQTFERYFITIAVLAKNGSGTLSRAKLERLCILTAQRISMLHEFDAPEFYDKTLFKHFIGRLKDTGIIRVNPDNKLEYNQTLERISDDAKTILSKEIRHGIIQVAPQILEEMQEEP